MENERELVLRIDDAEREFVEAVNAIAQKHKLPCFLMEPIVDKVHRAMIDGKNAEIAAAANREKLSAEQTIPIGRIKEEAANETA